MDQQRLDAIRARCEAATPGPWEAGRGDMATIVDGYESKWIYAGEKSASRYLAIASGYEIEDWDEVMANARFIAHARTDVPDLLAEVARLTAELSVIRTENLILIGEMAEVEQLTRELEAAERDTTIMLGTQRVCFACADRAPCRNSTTGEYACDPKWRGPQEDKP